MDEYTLGEWLINYSAGFVRRGISGSIIFSISDVLSIKPQLLINSALFVLFFLNLSQVALCVSSLSLSQTYWLLFSPALLLMIPTDTMARKENLFYLVLFIHAILVKKRSPWLSRFQKCVLPFTGLLITLSHEIYVFFLPFHILLVLLSGVSSSERGKIVLYNCLPILGLVAAVLFPGSYELRDNMCKSLLQFSIPCKGGIEAIGMSAQVSAAHSLLVLKDIYSVQSYTLVYGITNLVTLLLFTSSVFVIFEMGFLKIFAIANLVLPLLCMMGWDIGRWISLVSIHNFFVLWAVGQGGKKRNLNSGSDLIRSLFLGFLIVLFSLFLNNKYRAQYDRIEYPVTASRIPAFLHSGFNWFVNRPKFNSYFFGRKIKSGINLNEVLTSDDARLYFLGWSEPQNKGRWSTEFVSSIVFSLKEGVPDLIGKISLAVKAGETQQLACLLNGEKIFEGELGDKQTNLELKFDPKILKTKVNEHKLDFIFPSPKFTPDEGSKKGRVLVNSFVIE